MISELSINVDPAGFVLASVNLAMLITRRMRRAETCRVRVWKGAKAGKGRGR